MLILAVSLQGEEDVIRKPAFLAVKAFTSAAADGLSGRISRGKPCLCSHEWKREDFHTAALTNLIPGPQINNLD